MIFEESAMIKRNETATKANATCKAGARRLATSMLAVICVLMLGSGFFFAARQHFSSMDYGMKNSQMRKQIDKLEAEKRRLILAREISLSPIEIKKAAKRLGLMDPPVQNTQALISADPVDLRAATARTVSDKPLVQKTVDVKATPIAITAALKRPEKVEKPTKSVRSAE